VSVLAGAGACRMRKRDAVLRFDLETPSRALGVTAAALSG
jgi:hypothetical protein